MIKIKQTATAFQPRNETGMKQVTYQGYIHDAFTIERTSKNTYRIVRYDNVHHVVHSQREVFEFLEQQGIYSFEIVDLYKEKEVIGRSVSD